MDPYEIKEKIGRGSYSEVFMGVNVYNGERCVIKILKPGNSSDQWIAYSLKYDDKKLKKKYKFYKTYQEARK